MVAVSRFVEFATNAQTLVDGKSTDAEGKGTRGFVKGFNLGSGTDTFTVVNGSNDELVVDINGTQETITLASGTDLDARFVARDIAYKLHAANSIDDFKFAQCEWRNGGQGTNSQSNSFIIYTGQLGNNAAANDVTLGTATDDAKSLLGFDGSPESVAGADFAGNFTGNVVITGSYGGQFDDFYTVQISENETVGTLSATGGNTYNGTATAGGIFTGASDNLYTITIDTNGGANASMGQGSGNVPTFQATDATLGDDNLNNIELLYADHWYDVGAALGVRIKFSDAAFGDGDTFTIQALVATGTGYPKAIGAAQYIWSSSREDSSKAFSISPITTSTSSTQVGTKGAEIQFNSASDLDLGDLFSLSCIGPQPLVEDTTQLNFGNVTVSTQSSVKTVWFEIISGAVAMNTVKFSLQNEGTFQHHDTGNNDTEFHFGTVGAGDIAVGGGPTSNSQVEFAVNTSTSQGRVVAADIEDNTAPSYLAITVGDLPEVNSADAAQDISNVQNALVADFVHLAIKLGANETGANSTINYRMYFDFS